MKRQELAFLIVGMILAAVAGGLIGDLVGSFLPEGTIKKLFMTNIEIGLGRGVEMQRSWGAREQTPPDELAGSQGMRAIADSIAAAAALQQPSRVVEPLTINLYALTLIFGITLKINFVSVLFVLLVFVYFQWWYL